MENEQEVGESGCVPQRSGEIGHLLGFSNIFLTRFPPATGGIAELIEQSVVENLAECEENQNLLRCILGAKQDKRFISDH